jgi:hypothetical protein
MITLTQPAASTLPCQFSVNVIDDTGEPVNPTGDEVQVMYYPVTSPPAAFNPGSATWYAATWSVSGSETGSPVYWINFMPGPANSGAALAAGYYIVVGQVIDNPAVPLLSGCRLVLTAYPS